MSFVDERYPTPEALEAERGGVHPEYHQGPTAISAYQWTLDGAAWRALGKLREATAHEPTAERAAS